MLRQAGEKDVGIARRAPPIDELEEAFRCAFISSVDETLGLMGKQFKQSVLRHVDRRTSLTLDDVVVKPREFMEPVTEVLGAGAVQIIELEIARRFYRKLGLVFSTKPNHGLAEYLEEAKKQLAQNRGSPSI